MPSIVGIGLVALDVVIADRSNEKLDSSAGGSCGNVLAILSYLGWQSKPVARLDAGETSERIRCDLSQWGVDLDWLSLEPTAPAPVFIERLSFAPDGTAHHKFVRFCPECGGRLPQHRHVTRTALLPLLDSITAHDVLYIDRPSAAAVAAAEYCSAAGMLVIFEPSATGDTHQIHRIAASASLVKYSDDRLSIEDRHAISTASPALEIETLGADGMRYRVSGADWNTLPGLAVDAVDTAGAGDWTTAGLLYSGSELLSSPKATLVSEEIESLLIAAQTFGAYSCQFIGPRGAMNKRTATDTLREVGALEPTRREEPTRASALEPAFSCSNCES